MFCFREEKTKGESSLEADNGVARLPVQAAWSWRTQLQPLLPHLGIPFG